MAAAKFGGAKVYAEGASDYLLSALTVNAALLTSNRYNGPGYQDYGAFSLLTLILSISGTPSLAGGHTIDVYVQYSPDGGYRWDDLAHFTQITSGNVATYGPRIAYANPASGSSVADAALSDAAIAANTIVSKDFCDTLRAVIKGGSLADPDSVVLDLKAFGK